jgi:hypothetical protein
MTRDTLAAQYRNGQISRAEYERELKKLPPEPPEPPAENYIGGSTCRCCFRWHEDGGAYCISCEAAYAE